MQPVGLPQGEAEGIAAQAPVARRCGQDDGGGEQGRPAVSRLSAWWAYSGAPDLMDQEFARLLLADDVNARSTAALTQQRPAVEQ